MGAALHLVARQVPRRFPNVRFIVPHFGGLLPTLLARLVTPVMYKLLPPDVEPRLTAVADPAAAPQPA